MTKVSKGEALSCVSYVFPTDDVGCVYCGHSVVGSAWVVTPPHNQAAAFRLVAAPEGQCNHLALNTLLLHPGYYDDPSAGPMDPL